MFMASTQLQLAFGLVEPRPYDEWVLRARHVDDSVVASDTLCPCCLEELQTFALPRSIGFSVKGRGPSLVFLDLSITVVDHALYLAPNNPNALFAAGVHPRQTRARIPPFYRGGWSDTLLKAYLSARLVSHARAAGGKCPP